MDDDLEAALQHQQAVAEAWEARERALADTETVREDLARRQEARKAQPAWRTADPVQWTPPPQRQRQPSIGRNRDADPKPPVPDKIVIPKHDSTGRITETASFEGTTAAAAATWQNYIEQRIGQRIDDFVPILMGGLDIFDKEIAAAERARSDAEIGGFEARIAELEERLKQLETRAATGPRLVDNAAD